MSFYILIEDDDITTVTEVDDGIITIDTVRVVDPIRDDGQALRLL